MQHVDGLGQSSLPHVCWCSKMEIFCETLLIKTSQNSDIYRNRKPGKWKYFAKYFFIKTVQNRDTYIYKNRKADFSNILWNAFDKKFYVYQRVQKVMEIDAC